MNQEFWPREIVHLFSSDIGQASVKKYLPVTLWDNLKILFAYNYMSRIVLQRGVLFPLIHSSAIN